MRMKYLLIIIILLCGIGKSYAADWSYAFFDSANELKEWLDEKDETIYVQQINAVPGRYGVGSMSAFYVFYKKNEDLWKNYDYCSEEQKNKIEDVLSDCGCGEDSE